MKLENEKIIEKFLFDEMSGEERFDFEEKFITDEKLFEEVTAVEDELIEKYVRGWMLPAEQARFEKRFLTTRKRRERVEFSRQLFEKLREHKEDVVIARGNEVTAAEASWWDKFIGFFATPKLALASGFALLLVVFGSWFIYQNFSSETQIVRNENTDLPRTPEPVLSPTPEDSPDQLPENNTDDQNDATDLNTKPVNNNSSGQVKNSNSRANKQPRKSPKPKRSVTPRKTPKPVKTPEVPRVAPNPVLTLIAGTVRSGGKNNVLTLPKNARGATLRLRLESIDYKTYRAQLTDADGRVIFQRTNLKARRSTVNFFIPAKNLKRGDYIIRLSGRSETGDLESVADFQFRVNG